MHILFFKKNSFITYNKVVVKNADQNANKKMCKRKSSMPINFEHFLISIIRNYRPCPSTYFKIPPFNSKTILLVNLKNYKKSAHHLRTRRFTKNQE